MTKKIQFKNSNTGSTRWEKRWINVGHMKLLKWVPTKIKRPTPTTSGTVRKDGVLSRGQVPVATNMETRYTRSNRRLPGGDKTKNTEQDDAFEIMYLNSLPKTRRTTKKMDQLQKKHLADAGVTDDLQPSSADEKSTTAKNIIKTPTPKRAPGRVKSMLSPSQDNTVGSDNELLNSTTKSNDDSPLKDINNNNNNKNNNNNNNNNNNTTTPTNKNNDNFSNNNNITTTTTTSAANTSKLDEDMDEENNSKIDDDADESSSDDDEIIVGDEDDEDEENKQTENSNKNNNNKTANDNSSNNNNNYNNNGLKNFGSDKMEFDSLHGLDGGPSYGF